MCFLDAQWQDSVLPNAPVLKSGVNKEYRRVIKEPDSGWKSSLFDVAVKVILGTVKCS